MTCCCECIRVEGEERGERGERGDGEKLMIIQYE
jgi:hypothetical protein